MRFFRSVDFKQVNFGRMKNNPTHSIQKRTVNRVEINVIFRYSSHIESPVLMRLSFKFQHYTCKTLLPPPVDLECIMLQIFNHLTYAGNLKRRNDEFHAISKQARRLENPKK